MVGRMRSLVLACLLMASFAGCLDDASPEAEAALVDAFLGEDDEADEVEDAEAPQPKQAEAPAVEATSEPTVAEPVATVEEPKARAPRSWVTMAGQTAGPGASTQQFTTFEMMALYQGRSTRALESEPMDTSPPAASGPSEPLPIDLVALCPTDGGALDLGGIYFSETGGGQWVYAESNGMAGLQRDDESFPTSCPQPDTLIF